MSKDNAKRKEVTWGKFVNQKAFQMGYASYMQGKPFVEMLDMYAAEEYELGRQVACWFKTVGITAPTINYRAIEESWRMQRALTSFSLVPTPTELKP